MVYTYAMWDEDGHQVSEGLYETDARPTTTAGPDQVPIEFQGRIFRLDADDMLLKAHSFFKKKIRPGTRRRLLPALGIGAHLLP